MVTGLEGPLVGATVGQAKGIIDALLGPKIERIRTWAKEKDISKQLSAERLEVAFRGYLARSIAAADCVQSIVFPQRPLSLADIYEPLVLNCELDNGRLPVSQFISDFKRSIIVDSAGMGKTTFSKFLVGQIIAHTDQIPIFCSLRNLETDASLLDFIRSELDEIDSKFDPDLFLKLTKMGKFYFLLDGFDEIASADQADVRVKIEEFSSRCKLSSILVTSRPQASIPVFANGRHFSFSDLTEDQASSLVRRYDAFASIDVGERLIKHFHLVPSALLKSPMLVALLYRSFGVNNTISANVTSFYGDAYEALYRGHDLTKAGFSRPKKSGLDMDDFRRALEMFCFYCMLSGTSSWHCEEDLTDTLAKSAILCKNEVLWRNFMEDLLVAVPLIVREGLELRFIHRTFCEYFAAQFITRSPDSAKLIKQVQESAVSAAFSQTWEYISEISPSLARRAFAVPLAKKLARQRVSGHLSAMEMCKLTLDYALLWSHSSGLQKLVGSEARRLVLDCTSSWFAYGHQKSRDVSFAVTSGRKRDWQQIPEKAFVQLTKPMEIESVSTGFSQLVGDELCEMIQKFPRNSWILLDSKKLSELLDNQDFQNLANYLCYQHYYTDSRGCHELRTVDEKSYKAVLNDEQIESSRMADIGALIGTARGAKRSASM